MIPTQLFPALNLRMKCSMSGPIDYDWEMAMDQLTVMVEQDMNDRCGDYLGNQGASTSSSGGDARSPMFQENQALDATARKKMIDWKFRVADHFGIDREVVASSTLILDRFLYKSKCNDRMTFKLAAMSSFFLAAKIQDQSQLTVDKLAELSRGEYSVKDIVQMEHMILQSLSWRVNPVTVQSFVHSFMNLVPIKNAMIKRAVYDRAIFFAELCLFDYSYVEKPRSTIAAAAILNALEGIDGGCLTGTACETEFIQEIQLLTALDLMGASLDMVREDLWYIYCISSQYHEEDMLCTEPAKDIMKGSGTVNRIEACPSSRSPVSVLSRKTTYSSQ